MPSIGTLLGLSGPNGTYFCNNCLIKQADLIPRKGVLHALHLLIVVLVLLMYHYSERWSILKNHMKHM
jgi:hypothetical protein